MRRKTMAFLLAIITVINVMCAPVMVSAQAMVNGYHVNINRSAKSNVLIIGDSRVCGMASDAGSTKVSFNATVGAHYIYYSGWVTGQWANNNMVIASDKYLQQQKAIVKDTIKKKGSCKVVIMATINDVGFYNWQSTTLARITLLANELKAVNKSKVTVYVTGIIPQRNQDAQVSGFNALLKKKFGSKYIVISAKTSTWNNYYAADSVHLTKAGSKLLFNKIVTAIGCKGLKV